MFWIKALLILALAGVGVVVSWAVTDTALNMTSDQQFCGSCHSMKPMQASFLRDPHGGRSTRGVRADCSDCHLPHDNHVNYLFQKARSGAWDIWMEFVIGAEEVDWHAIDQNPLVTAAEPAVRLRTRACSGFRRAGPESGSQHPVQQKFDRAGSEVHQLPSG